MGALLVSQNPFSKPNSILVNELHMYMYMYMYNYN